MTQRAATGALWVAIGNWGNQVATFVVFTVLTRLLEPALFGIVAFASVFLALVKVLAEQGMADAIVQRAELGEADLDTAFWSSVVGGILLGGGLGAAAWGIAGVVDRPEAAPVLAGLSVSVAIAGFGNVQRGVLTRAFDFRGLALRSLASSLGGGIVGIGMALGGAGVWSLVGQTIAFEVFGVATLWASSPWRPGRNVSRTALVELTRFGSSVVGYKTLNFLNTRSDNFVIGVVLGAEPLGFYVVAYRLLQLLTNSTTSIVGKVAFPLMSRVQHDRDAVLASYYRVVRITSLLAFPAFAGVTVLAPELVSTAFGDQWAQSVPTVRVLSIAGLVQSVLLVNGIVMKSLGRPGWRVRLTAVNAVLNIPAFVLAARWGIVGVASAFLAVTLLVSPLWWRTVARLVPLRLSDFLRQLAAPAFATIVMVGGVTASRLATTRVPSVVALVLLVAVGIVLYAGALRLVDRRVFDEAVAMTTGAARGLRTGSGRP